MAFRRPLKISGTNLKEMTDSEIDGIQSLMVKQYSNNPSVLLSVNTNNEGNLAALTDSRLLAGTYATNASRFPTEEETNEPRIANVKYRRLDQSESSPGLDLSGGNLAYPAYYTADGNIQAMSLQDMYDTFVYDVITTLTTLGTVDEQPYALSTSTSLAGYSRVNVNAIFRDSTANASLYTGDTIPIDDAGFSSVTQENVYLFKRNFQTLPSFTAPAQIQSNGSVKEYTDDVFRNMTENMIRYVAKNVVGQRIEYEWDITGATIPGGTIYDRRLNGSGNYKTQFVGADDYRAQEWPNGTAVIVNTYLLKVRKH